VSAAPRTAARLDALAAAAVAAVDADAVVSLARDLVRIPSVYRPEVAGADETAVASFLAEHLRGLGLAVTVEEAAPGRPNVTADWVFERPGRGLILEGHTDVVTEGDPAAWTDPPFAGVLRDDRLYGRGAADMKGGLAAAACALDAARRACPALAGRVRLAAVADEEAMMLGIKAFIRAGRAEGYDGAIVCEPEENEICLHQKGAIRLLATFRGRMAHGAMPYAGANPIPAAARFVEALVEQERREQARRGAHRFLGRPHITPTTIRAPAQGTPQFNVMAGEAQVTVDVRTIPGQDHAALVEALREAAASAAGPDARVSAAVELVEDRPWTETPADAPVVRAVERAVRTALGREPTYGGVPGTTDGTFLHAWAGLPVVTIGPGNRHIPHQADEHVEIAQLIAAAHLYAAAIVYFLGQA
jgi:succinyl-diaminopimelate desuccinylase